MNPVKRKAAICIIAGLAWIGLMLGLMAVMPGNILKIGLEVGIGGALLIASIVGMIGALSGAGGAG